MKPLEGIRVLELATFVAAPVCARLLSDLGADVIKVERPSGDDWRSSAITYCSNFSNDANPVFDLYNTGKRSIALDLKSEDGMAVFRKLLSQADVFITNTRPNSLKRLGLAYEDIKEQYPGLVYAMLVGYGEKGPDAAKPAFDVTAFWARSGFLRDQAALNNDYTPVIAPFGAGDTVAGTTLLAEICAALLRKERTGLGDCVRSGLYQSGIFTFGTMQIITQNPWGRKMPTSPDSYSLQGCYRCSDDEWVFVSTGNPAVSIPKFCRLIGRPELMEDPRFSTNEARKANLSTLHRIFDAGVAALTCEECLKLGEELDLPVVRVPHYSDVTQDEQAWVNGYLEQVTFRDGQQMTMPASPLSMDCVGQLHTTYAPYVGENTVAILDELGYTEEEIEHMKKAGAIHTC